MEKLTRSVIMAVVATLASTADAASPQEQCDYARFLQWGKYASCVEKVLAKEAKGVVDLGDPFGKCRHRYFAQWDKFQTSAALAGTTCVGPRFTDNGDGTVTDALTALVWEKKTNDGGVHDWDNLYGWSTGAPYRETGTVFTTFLGSVNGGGGFAGANGWRLPTMAELQSIVLDFPCAGLFGYAGCSCPVPCIDGVFGLTQPGNFFYWTTTPYLPNALGVRGVNFNFNGHAPTPQKTQSGYVRAVRGGL